MNLTLYMPHTLKEIEFGFFSLAGKYNSSCNGSLEEGEIVFVIHDEIQPKIERETIGIISKGRDESLQRSTWIEINNSHNLVFESVTIDDQKIAMHDITVIYYNSSDILSSSILKRFFEMDSMNSIDYFIKTILKTNSRKKSCPSWLIKFFFLIFNFFSPLLNNLRVNLERLCFFLNNSVEFRSIFLDQLLLRTKQLQALQQFVLHNNNWILVGRIFFIIVTDVIIGATIIYIIATYTSAANLHFNFLLAAKNFAGYILSLLHWLKGAPAGLKLNQPVAEALSSFFSYIVYLLLFYLELASTPLKLLANLFMLVGFLGVSFQAALLADLLKLSTLHIYCLYIYAARIHMVQLSLLGSHWRGFRGKKWNPLKNRIDSRDESTMRPSVKIFTVVIFTFVIFLLPTTTVYYAVFLNLRLLFLSLQALAIFLIWALNSNPLYVFWLSYIGSPSVNGDVCFELDSDWINSFRTPLVLKLNISSSPVAKILKATLNEEVFPSCPMPSFSYICNSLIYARELL